MNEITEFLLSTDEIQNASDHDNSRFLLAGDFLFNGDATDLRMVWGPDNTPLWAHGESLMIVGPPSTGKSTLAQRLVFSRIGLVAPVLDYPVADDTGRVLYLAMDRPNQVKRSMVRMVGEDAMTALNERMIVWRGPLPVDITNETNRDWLADLAIEEGVTTIVIDSLKDAVIRPSDEERASGYNSARQECLARDIEWLEIHHNRKSGADNRKPRTLDDVYGSRMLSAGAGSILSLWGEPGGSELEMTQIKPLGDTHKPLKLNLDGGTGDFEATESESWMDAILIAGSKGITAKDLADQFYGAEHSQAQYDSLRKKLQRRVDLGELETVGERRERCYRIPVRGKK